MAASSRSSPCWIRLWPRPRLASGRSVCGQVVADGEERGLGAVAEAGLGEDGRDVVLDGALGQRQPLGDLMVGGAGAEQPQHLDLPMGQQLTTLDRSRNH